MPPAVAQDAGRGRDSLAGMESGDSLRGRNKEAFGREAGRDTLADALGDTLGYEDVVRPESVSPGAPVEGRKPGEVDQANSDTVGYRNLPDLFETGMAIPSLTTWTRLVEAAGMEAELREGEYTILAPTDEAFDRLRRERLDGILANRDKARRLASAHIVRGIVRASEITERRRLRTLAGDELRIRTNRAHREPTQRVHIGEAHIVRPDIPADNGVIHGIDRVLAKGD
ncbi:MAG TPA: fasciclin domain-containing protein [Gemmatimonadales bacterium]|nr:fasciclin domain-containing protein [Gemmatimonadales bacterium]